MDVVPGEDDFLTGLAVDSAGSTVVAGFVSGGFGGYETVKLDAAGDVAWSDNESSVLGNTLGPAFVAVAGNDEIVVTGVPESSCGLLETSTWKLSPDGVRLWTHPFPTAFCDTAEAVDMALDHDGNVLVLCQATIQGEGDSFDFITLKYDPDGNELWRRTLTNGNVDQPEALDIDRAGNVYITGQVGFPGNIVRPVAASYTPGGALRWSKLFHPSPLKWPMDIVVGPVRGVYVSGIAFSASMIEDIFTVRLQQVPFALPR